MWHQAGGPARVTNGLALCSLHHKTFDLGAFTILDEMELAVSDEASGTEAFERQLMAFHGRWIRQPVHSEESPDLNSLAWHRGEVFRGKPRPANKGVEA
jgi:putative restriction endonuclease